MNEGGFLTCSQAAKALRRADGYPSRQTVYRQVLSGDLPAVRPILGGPWLIPRAAVDLMLAARSNDESPGR
jgi:excisionase family DNA binding protein